MRIADRAVIVLSCLVVTGFAACVNWHDGKGWHRPATGMEAWLAKNFVSGQGRAECKGTYPGVTVMTAIFDETPVNHFAIPNCLGDIHGAIEEARVANHLTAADLQGCVVTLTDEYFACGPDFHSTWKTGYCVSPDCGILVNARTMHKSLKRAFAHLHTFPEQ